MGIVKDALTKSVEFVKEEILPIRYELMKAGLLTPDRQAYDSKSSLVDPLAYGQTAFGYKEKYSILSYDKCRQITYADPIVASIIQTRTNQVATFKRVAKDKYALGFKIKLRDDDKSPSKAEEKRIKEIEQFIQNCGVPENFEDTPEMRKRDDFETFLRKITRDSLTFDQVNFEVVPRNDGKPYSFLAVDASTIRIIPDKKEMVERFDYNQSTKESQFVIDYGADKYFKEFKPKHPKFCQVINGVKRHVYDEWEMAFGVRNPRTDMSALGYGFSEIEMLVTTITSHMNAETYNRKFFSQGSSIKGILTFEGMVPPDQLEAFRRQWYAQVTGVNNAWRTPIMSLGKDGKMNWQSLHSTNREMEFGKWLEYCIKTICGVFMIDPIEIGFDISKQGSGQNSGSGGLGSGNQGERLEYSKDKGLRPLLAHIESLLNSYIIWRLDPNFEIEFVGLNASTEKDDLDKCVQMVKNFKTINEIRAEHDLKPLPDFEKIKNPGDVVLDSSLINFIQSQQAAAQQQQNPEMGGPGPEGDASQPGGAPQQQAGDTQEAEPDYENMSVEELQAELQKLEGQAKGQGETQKSQARRFFEELEL
ncbi:phage portal protein [bacterium]|nr:phage portal protein [bacterium]